MTRTSGSRLTTHASTRLASPEARVALAWAAGSRVSGVTACGAGFSGRTVPKQVRFRVYATAGVHDERYTRLTEALLRGDEPARRSLVQTLRRDSERPEDDVHRRAARRVLVGSFVSSIEQANGLLAGKKYSEAARMWQLAVLLRPEYAEGWYSLAVSEAAAHEKRRALNALEEAIAHGFRDRDRILGDPLLEPVRKEPR